LCRLAELDGVALLCTLHQPELAAIYFPRVLEMSAGRICNDRRSSAQFRPSPGSARYAKSAQELDA
jgi:ABC-type phosphate/phosphonate transport system ATPase subunit